MSTPINKSPLLETYLAGVHERLPQESLDELALARGASVQQLDQLRQAYPLCPDTLLQLLSIYNGTYHEKYPGGTVSVYLLGSDAYEYPYYLSSVEQILEDQQ